MKRICVLVLCVSMLLSGCGMAQNEQGTDNNINQTESNETVLEKVNADFQQIMTIGTDLMSVLEAMTTKNEYESLKKADGYVKDMKLLYSDLLAICEKNEDMAGMLFQLKILDHSCPNPIAGKDTTSINNQKILYQLHLKQLSSSFTYMSEYMDYLAGNRSKPDGVAYFKEVAEMPTPDTVMYEITYDSEKTDSGVKQYMYLIGDTEEDANMNYNAYIVALGTIDGLSVEITSNAVYVNKNGSMVSAMMAGTDSQKGRFMIVSFQE